MMADQHTVAWTHVVDTHRDPVIHAAVTCPGGDIACCLYCPADDEDCRWPGDARSGSKCTCGRTLESGWECRYTPWFKGTLIADMFDGPTDTPVHDGPIDFYWDGDNWLWRYAEIDDDRGDGQRSKLIGAVIITASTVAMLHQELGEFWRWVL